MAHARTLRFTAAALLLGLGALVAGTATIGWSTQVDAAPKGWKLPANAKRVGPNIYDIGTRTVGGRTLRGYAFLDQGRSGKARPDGKGKPDEGGGGGTSSCYAYIVKGAKWKSTEGYHVDSSGGSRHSSLTDAKVLAAIDGAIAEWENAADGKIDGNSVNVFGSRLSQSVDESSIGETTNGANEVAFGPISEPGTIAVTFVWGWFSGKPNSREIVEWDQLYDDDGDWTWGDVLGGGNSTHMDFDNIATHEVGHALGMGHPDGSCTEETMHATAAKGETKKRDLNDGDIAGIDRLY
jgi:hypothetical protein